MNYFNKIEVMKEWIIEKCIANNSFENKYIIRNINTNMKAYLRVIEITFDKMDVRLLNSDRTTVSELADKFNLFYGKIKKRLDIIKSLNHSNNTLYLQDYELVKHNNGIEFDILIRQDYKESLRDYIKSHVIHENDVINMGINICSSLQAFHNREIKHEHIIPENIFIDKKGEFSLGNFMPADNNLLDKMGIIVKDEENYMSPEEYLRISYKKSSDIYSLGIIMYQCLNQMELPFMSNYPKILEHYKPQNSILIRMRGIGIPSINGINSKLNEIILKACEFEKSNRYSDALSMKEELSSILK